MTRGMAREIDVPYTPSPNRKGARGNNLDIEVTDGLLLNITYSDNLKRRVSRLFVFHPVVGRNAFLFSGTRNGTRTIDKKNGNGTGTSSFDGGTKEHVPRSFSPSEIRKNSC